ncbi:MAG: hypothetical protein EZS28_015966 [Streblomastix strix]|uniref:J domain-containing protein n=1 Tax=Streblomastix strix TaxID=222440 RepID=A0A5J4W0V1_9EUKA|nr:MAG: hypothetical protein EZS28_015966 [Streblomastix strix]
MNYYQILGVEKNADDDTIKKAYHKLALKCHPDKFEEANQQFKKIVEAYDTLSDKKKRKIYDQVVEEEESESEIEDILKEQMQREREKQRKRQQEEEKQRKRQQEEEQQRKRQQEEEKQRKKQQEEEKQRKKQQEEENSNEIIKPGPKSLIISGKSLLHFSGSEDVNKVFSMYGKLSKVTLKLDKSRENIIFLEFTELGSAERVISELNGKPLTESAIRRLVWPVELKDTKEPQIYCYKDSDFVGAEELDLKDIYQNMPFLKSERLRVSFIAERQFLPTLFIKGLNQYHTEDRIKNMIEEMVGMGTVSFVKIDQSNYGKKIFRAARVAMKNKKDGDIVIERGEELEPLTVDWYIPKAKRG